MPSLAELTSQNLQTLSISQMQKLLADGEIPFDDCVEKEHLVARLTEHMPPAPAQSDDDNEDGDDGEGLAEDDWFKSGPQVSREEEAAAVGNGNVCLGYLSSVLVTSYTPLGV